MSIKFHMTRDISGYNGFGLIPSEDVWGTTLITGVAQTFTVPSNASNWVAVFMIEPGDAVWAALNTTAALPGGSVAKITSELNPSAWSVKGGDTISVITSDASDNIAIKYYINED